MLENIFFEFSALLFLGALLGVLARVLHQPLILAYIFTGIFIASLSLIKNTPGQTLSFFSSLGIAFLLFLVGLEFRWQDLKIIGRAALLTGLGQIIFTAAFGFLLVLFLGFSILTSLYVAIALTFSSTIIVVKLLSDKNDLQSLYGKIAIGFLLVQDFVAILILIFLAGFSQDVSQTTTFLNFFLLLPKGLLLFGTLVILSRYVLPKFFRYAASSDEFLFLSAIAWAFLFASFSFKIGFSLETGAFLAGFALANSPYHLQISAKIRPLRDFFLIIFFVVLGLGMNFSALSNYLFPAIILSLFVLIGNPLIVLLILRQLEFKKRTSFLASVTVAQISEFSLIIVVMGQRVGHITSEIVSLVVLVGVITIIVSSYMIIYSNWLYKKLMNFLSIFEKKVADEPSLSFPKEVAGHTVLVGCSRMGGDLLKVLQEKKKEDSSLVIIDFNPLVVKKLTSRGIGVIFGDVSDPEVLETLKLEKAELIISTVSNLEDNLALIDFVIKRGFVGTLVVTASFSQEAIKLYKAGASYVILPHLLGGQHLALLLERHWDDLSYFNWAREYHLSELLEKT